MTVFKGIKSVILSNQFSKFVITHPVSKAFREWTKDIEIPDEAFFSTLAQIRDITQDKHTGNYSVKQNQYNLEGKDSKKYVRQFVKQGFCPRHCLL